MFQQQNAFLSDGLSDVDCVALRALTILAARRDSLMDEGFDAGGGASLPRLETHNDRLFLAATASDPAQVGVVLDQMRLAGISEREILSISLPNVARQLGAAWVNDSMTFGAVTIGCARLQSVVRQIDGAAAQKPARDPVANCLVVVPEGAQHTLGAIVLTTQLRRGGANVVLELDVSSENMAHLLRSDRYDAVMIFASKSENLENLNALIKSSRRKGSNAKVIVGGSILEERFDLVTAVGTDYVSNDWQEALNFCARGWPLALKSP